MTTDDVLNGRTKWCVEHSRCEAFSSALPDGCVNLLWLDPPYFRVVDEEWDRAWKTEADFLAWLRGVVAEAARVLAPNGSLYLFASPQMGGRVECIARESLDVLNHIVWAKRQGWHAKAEEAALRGYFPQTERIIFAETLDVLRVTGAAVFTLAAAISAIRGGEGGGAQQAKGDGQGQGICGELHGFLDALGLLEDEMPSGRLRYAMSAEKLRGRASREAG